LLFGAFAFGVGAFFASMLFFTVYSFRCFIVYPIVSLATVER
jgi:hypothetical protein